MLFGIHLSLFKFDVVDCSPAFMVLVFIYYSPADLGIQGIGEIAGIFAETSHEVVARGADGGEGGFRDGAQW